MLTLAGSYTPARNAILFGVVRVQILALGHLLRSPTEMQIYIITIISLSWHKLSYRHTHRPKCSCPTQPKSQSTARQNASRPSRLQQHHSPRHLILPHRPFLCLQPLLHSLSPMGAWGTPLRERMYEDFQALDCRAQEGKRERWVCSSLAERLLSRDWECKQQCALFFGMHIYIYHVWILILFCGWDLCYDISVFLDALSLHLGPRERLTTR